MTAQPVDVLGRLATMAMHHDEWEAVHDAVAELIEAGQRAATALEVFISGDYGTRRNPDPGRNDPDVVRLRAALARCGGQS